MVHNRAIQEKSQFILILTIDTGLERSHNHFALGRAAQRLMMNSVQIGFCMAGFGQCPTTNRARHILPTELIGSSFTQWKMLDSKEDILVPPPVIEVLEEHAKSNPPPVHGPTHCSDEGQITTHSAWENRYEGY